jgi:hypothetical protein
VDPISELSAKLIRHPELEFIKTSNSIEIRAPSTSGFSVRLYVQSSFYTVAFEGWHEDFDSPLDALDCVAFAFSGQSRLAVTYRGNRPVKWELEYLENGEWVVDSEVGLLSVPFWRLRRKVYLQNPDLLTAA